jgi:homocysteine S-methyltransferase
VYELLRRSPEVEFDEHIFHAGLIYDPRYAAVLERVYRSYIDTALTAGMSVVVGTATWRANRERVRASAFSGREVNQDNVRFLQAIRDSYADTGISILIEGDIGPRGDAYKPGEALDIDSARSFHAWQLEALACGQADYLQASTLPALSEATGNQAACWTEPGCGTRSQVSTTPSATTARATRSIACTRQSCCRR